MICSHDWYLKLWFIFSQQRKVQRNHKNKEKLKDFSTKKSSKTRKKQRKALRESVKNADQEMWSSILVIVLAVYR